ncbi:restriction endonuclease subunit S [Salinibacter ruber]|uniref:restriction endonuclease subunit S n=1 Tax=Salinibacter ruber TaxID=146919 RepID=UPI001F085C9D|nr:restriction endonuclease subunit S [Salinibacter ruber]
MSEDPDFDMEVVEKDEVDEMGTDGGSSPKEDFRPESSREESGTGTDETDDTESISSHSGSVATDSDREVFGLGSVPEEWNISSLPNVVEIEMGSSPPSSTYNEQEEGLPFYQGNADFGHMTPKVSTWCSDPVKTAGEDDVLISIRAPVGDLNIADEHCCIGRGLAALRPDKMNGFYLFYGLAQRSRWLSRLASGSTFKSVSSADLEKVDLPVPPLPEQRKIASVLYAVDQAIQKTEAIIEQAKRVKRGLLQDLFSFGVGSDDRLRDPDQNPGSFRETKLGSLPSDWEVIPMGKAISTLYRYPSYYDIEYVDKGVPEVRGELLRPDGTINLSTEEIRYVSEETASEYPRVRLEENDFVISVRGTVGKVGRIPPSLAGGVITANLIRVKFDTDLILPDYAQVMLLSRQFQRRLDALTSATTIKTIKADDLRRIPVRLPNFSEQQRISKVVQSRTEKVRKEQAQLDELLRLKKGLMQNLLTGEVRTMNKAIEVLGEVKAHG